MRDELNTKIPRVASQIKWEGGGLALFEPLTNCAVVVVVLGICAALVGLEAMTTR
jgi:uncharacterized membrane protein HdeD (DUF308 family)